MTRHGYAIPPAGIMSQSNMKTLSVVRFCWLMAFVVVAGAGLHADDKKPPIAVYVFTAATTGGFVDVDAKQRADGLRELLHELKGDKSLSLIDAKDGADVILEVLHNRLENADATIVGEACGYGSRCITRLHVTLTARGYTAEIVGVTFPAHSAAQQIEKWIDQNRAQLLQRHMVTR